MEDARLEWRSHGYFPYELEFAKLEVERLFDTHPRTYEHGLRIESGAFRSDEADRVTYFARVLDPDGRILIPRQMRLEATATDSRRERQSTRYSAHGLHEYKGKFNPQVVRAIGNILGLGHGAAVLDPFAGSGTTLLECAHAGWTALGFDINPLAVLIANAKIHALRIADGTLQRIADAVVAQVEPYVWLSTNEDVTSRDIDTALGSSWREMLPSYEYLASWFQVPVLAQASIALGVLQSTVTDPRDRAIFEVLLSDQLRDCSLQEPADLRIRRRKERLANYPLLISFLDAIKTRIPRVVRARAEIGEVEGSQHALLHDVTGSAPLESQGLGWGSFDAIITSPPYAAALPYIDTQRLSLVLLGHVRPEAIRAAEARLMGARDLTKRERLSAEHAIRTGDKDLPSEVLSFCEDLLDAASRTGNGFRRKNKPALVYRYLRQMSSFFQRVKSGLKPGAKAAFVIGVNRTELGGEEFTIDTPSLITAVAEHCGYRLVDNRRMDTYARYDLHQQNSIDSERLVILEAPTSLGVRRPSRSPRRGKARRE